MQERKRHGFLTLWLIIIIGANSIEVLRQFFFRDILMEAYPTVPEWVFIGIGLTASINIICATALFKWKKWGFWGFLLSSLAGVILYLQLEVGVQALGSLVGVTVLFIALNIGGERKGWYQLE